MKKDVLEVLYQKYYNVAYLYTLSLCKNKETAEDIASDAFEKAYLTLNDQHKEFKFWLLLVCKNLWIDRLRRKKYVSDQVLEEMIVPDLQHNPEKQLMAAERKRLLYEVMLELPQRYREVLALHYFAGLPLTKIEKIMNLSSSNVKTLAHRARTKLKQKLEVYGYEF